MIMKPDGTVLLALVVTAAVGGAGFTKISPPDLCAEDLALVAGVLEKYAATLRRIVSFRSGDYQP
jgi:hypothetical protein